MLVSGSTGETGRRTLRMFLDNYGREGTAIGTDDEPIEGVPSKELTRLVKTRELWFVLIANPDGYDYTFDADNRLWRKNLRDNNGDGQISAADGVDLNRNFRPAGSYDDEGSAPSIRARPTAGPAPASEPETQAMVGLTDKSDSRTTRTTTPSAGWLLWPPGLAGRHALRGRAADDGARRR